MSNVISNIVPQLLAGALPTLREQAVTPRLVNKSIGNETRDRGDTIDVPIPSAISQRDVTPAVTHATNQDISPTKVQVALDQWKEASFHMSDSDAEAVMNGTIPMQAAEAVKALGNGLDSYVLGLYTGVYNYGGTASTTPFSTNLDAFKNARKWLNKSLAPMDDRSVVLDSDAEANALLLDVFLRADERGDQEGIIKGMIGRKLGADWYLNQNIPSHTAGSFVMTVQADVQQENAAIVSTTANTFTLQSSSTTTTIGGSLKVGDLFKFSGHDQTHVVTASASVAVAADATLAVTFAPSPTTQVAANTEVTLLGDHAVNMAFHRDAFAMASRPLSESQIGGVGGLFSSITDPVTGIALRLEISRQYKQTTYSYDILYGAKLTRANQAARILG